jgi:hypothetical protein
MAQVYNIKNNSGDSQQSVPNAAIVFLPYSIRDTFHATDDVKNVPSNAISTGIIISTSDLLSVSITNNKGSATQTADVMLTGQNYDYMRNLAPGDNAFIIMHNDAGLFQQVMANAQTKNAFGDNLPNGGFDSGLKFYGKVNAIREVSSTDGGTGIKSIRYNVTLKAFTELESQIYFNELLQSAAAAQILDLAKISDKWRALFDGKPSQNVEDVLNFIIETFLGVGPSPKNRVIKGAVKTPNQALSIPALVAQFLNFDTSGTKAIGYTYDDLLNVLIGIQKYPNSQVTDPNAKIFEPDISTQLNGYVFVPASNFSNSTVWGLLEQHCNGTINEMFTCLRCDGSGDIAPTLVIRQKPFTSKFFQNSNAIPVTNFLDLPVWSIAAERQIQNYNIGTSDAVRFNFIQVYGKSPSFANPDATTYNQLVAKNYAIDDLDILRTGGRFGTFTNNADVNGNGTKSNNLNSNIRSWTDLISDWYINGHLKLNGSITMSGIYEPICVGDNLQYQNVLFHIEGIEHRYSVDEITGTKSFMTTALLSNGIVVDGNYYYNITPLQASVNDKILPGISGDVNNPKLDANQSTSSVPSQQNQANNPALGNLIANNSATNALKNIGIG